MIGTLVNSITIIIGTIIGLALNKGIKEEYKSTIMDGIGLCHHLPNILCRGYGYSWGLRSGNSRKL